ncbi:MAG: OsmC family peroxiredoxin [Acidobacteria bacterium]|jgi:organic hydroperoxide reductase OsmC/OhrA|nr:MAG: OsmC family peroxiredoxin [Acidobacteriota bacterium]
MKITARVENAQDQHEVVLATDSVRHTLSIPPKKTGMGSSANGGELLFLALATCYCNDIYREAAKRGIEVKSVEVEVTGEFGTAGEPARDVTYRAKVEARASEKEIRDLMTHTDRIAEIQNSLRLGTKVTLAHVDPRSTIES